MKAKADRHTSRAADIHLWRLVTATIRPFPGRVIPAPVIAAAPPAAERRRPPPPAASQIQPTAPRPSPRGAQTIEPGRLHRLATGRDDLDGRLDLHGLSQDRAKVALATFVLRGHAEGRRAILVITGKGVLGDGVLRRRVPQWLAEAPLRPYIAGLSEAHRRHGGAGALYVTLRRTPRN